jgi:hypothetical protein
MSEIGWTEWLVILSVVLLSLFWIRMLFDAILHEPEPRSRLFWAALIFLTWVPGALAYALLRRLRPSAGRG